jgi:hypothetical protein
MLEHDLVSNFLSTSMDSSTIYLSPPPYHHHSIYTSELIYPPEAASSEHVLMSSIPRDINGRPIVYMNRPLSPAAGSPPEPGNSAASYSPSSSFSSELGSSPVQSTFEMIGEADSNYQFASYPPEWQDNSWMGHKPHIYPTAEQTFQTPDCSSGSNVLSPALGVKREVPLFTVGGKSPSPQMAGASTPLLVSPIHPSYSTPISPQVSPGFYDLQMMSSVDVEHAVNAFQRPPTPKHQGGFDPRMLSRNPTPDVAPTNNTFPGVFTPAGPEIAFSRDSDDVSGEDDRFESEEESGSGDSAMQRTVPSDLRQQGGSGLARRVSRPSRLTAPVPVPHLTKKSRGRRVPTSPTVVENGIEKSARTYVCDVSGCGKVSSYHLVQQKMGCLFLLLAVFCSRRTSQEACAFNTHERETLV